MKTSVWLWLFTGAVTSVLAPALLVAANRWRLVDRATVPSGLVAPLFVLLHGAVTASLLLRPPPAAWTLLHLALLAGATAYWLPVLGRRRRLDDIGRFLYLFLSSPFLDLAGVAIVALGQAPGGVAMISAMLPVNLAAVGFLWRYLKREEQASGEAPVLPWESNARALDTNA